MCGAKEDKKTFGPVGRQSSSAICVARRRRQRREIKELRTRLQNKVAAAPDGYSHSESKHLTQNEDFLLSLRQSFPLPTRFDQAMTSASLCLKCSNPILKPLPSCSGTKKMPALNIVATKVPKPSPPQHREDISNKIASKVSARQPYLSVMLSRNSPQSYCETSKTVSTLLARLPETPATGGDVLSACHLVRANRKRCSSDALGGRRISVLKFKRQKTSKYLDALLSG